MTRSIDVSHQKSSESRASATAASACHQVIFFAKARKITSWIFIELTHDMSAFVEDRTHRRVLTTKTALQG